jgi:hypothetical protein
MLHLWLRLLVRLGQFSKSCRSEAVGSTGSVPCQPGASWIHICRQVQTQGAQRLSIAAWFHVADTPSD